MKKNLEIFGVEDTKEGRPRVTATGKPYARIKTSEGWMSCFNKKVWETLRESIDKIACVEVKENGKFSNIEKHYGPEDVNLGVAQNEDKAVNSEVSEENLMPKENIASGNRSTTMYVSYAKDVFCALIEKVNDLSETSKFMEVAIKLVEQAKKAFS